MAAVATAAGELESIREPADSASVSESHDEGGEAAEDEEELGCCERLHHFVAKNTMRSLYMVYTAVGLLLLGVGIFLMLSTEGPDETSVAMIGFGVITSAVGGMALLAVQRDSCPAMAFINVLNIIVFLGLVVLTIVAAIVTYEVQDPITASVHASWWGMQQTMYKDSGFCVHAVLAPPACRANSSSTPHALASVLNTSAPDHAAALLCDAACKKAVVREYAAQQGSLRILAMVLGALLFLIYLYNAELQRRDAIVVPDARAARPDATRLVCVAKLAVVSNGLIVCVGLATAGAGVYLLKSEDATKWAWTSEALVAIGLMAVASSSLAIVCLLCGLRHVFTLLYRAANAVNTLLALALFGVVVVSLFNSKVVTAVNQGFEANWVVVAGGVRVHHPALYGRHCNATLAIVDESSSCKSGLRTELQSRHRWLSLFLGAVLGFLWLTIWVTNGSLRVLRVRSRRTRSRRAGEMLRLSQLQDRELAATSMDDPEAVLLK